MGVSVICAYEFETQRSRVFCQDNFSDFAMLCDIHDVLVGFNSIPFDNQVLRKSGIVDIDDSKCYDLLREIWIASGLGITFEYPSHAGFSLDAVAIANQVGQKSGNGATAPVDWQLGNIGTVIDYCLQDVALTTKLISLVRLDSLLCPKTGSKLAVRHP
jgi:hypothetical protein